MAHGVDASRLQDGLEGRALPEGGGRDKVDMVAQQVVRMLVIAAQHAEVREARQQRQEGLEAARGRTVANQKLDTGLEFLTRLFEGEAS